MLHAHLLKRGTSSRLQNEGCRAPTDHYKGCRAPLQAVRLNQTKLQALIRREALLMQRQRPVHTVGSTHVLHLQVQEAVRQMADVIAAYESAADTSDPETVKSEFEPVLAACMQPILTACQRSAEALALDAPTRSGA